MLVKSYWSNGKTNLVTFLHELSLLFCGFNNTTPTWAKPSHHLHLPLKRAPSQITNGQTKWQQEEINK